MRGYRSTIRKLTLPVFADNRGVLLAVENDDPDLPFRPARSFLIIDVPEGMVRAGHCHINCEQLLICIRGDLAAVLDDGQATTRIALDAPGAAIYVPAMTWLTLKNFSADAILYVLASKSFAATETIDDYERFILLARGQ